MKKIVIIDTLGYLGTEISKIYFCKSWKNKIITGLFNKIIIIKDLKKFNNFL